MPLTAAGSLVLGVLWPLCRRKETLVGHNHIPQGNGVNGTDWTNAGRESETKQKFLLNAFRHDVLGPERRR